MKQPLLKLSSLSIRGKLLLGSAVLVVLTAVFFGVIAYRNARDALRQSIGAAVAGAAYSTALDIQQELKEETTNVSTWANLSLMREIIVDDVDKNISRFLMGIKRDYSVHLDLAVTNLKGKVVAASNPALLGENWSSAPWFFAPTDKAEIAAGPISLPRYDKTSLIIIASVRDPERPSQPIGLLVAMYDWERVHARLDWVRHPAQLHGSELLVFLLDSTGTVIAEGAEFATPSTRIGTNLARQGWKAARLARRGKSGFLVQQKPLSALTGFAPLTITKRGQDVRWAVLVVADTPHAFAPVFRMQRNMAMVGLLAVGLAMALAMVMAGRIANPLRRVTEATRKVAEGGSAEVVPEIGSGDEIGALAAAFRAMVTDLRRAEEELVRSARLALLGELAAGIAHEVRTPIGVVKGAAQMLKRTVAGNPDAAELAEVIASEMDRLNRMTGSLLDYARPVTPSRTRRDLNKITQSALDFLIGEAERKQIQLTATFAEALPLVPCDSDQIHDVLLNIALNAIQMTPKNGRVRMATGHVPEERAVYVSVEDTGPGISKESLAKIFKPFFTERQGGTGLGLAIAHRIVEAHGGHIEVRSSLGSGATFVVMLPVGGEER